MTKLMFEPVDVGYGNLDPKNAARLLEDAAQAHGAVCTLQGVISLLNEIHDKNVCITKLEATVQKLAKNHRKRLQEDKALIACLQADKETILGDRGRQAAYIKSLQHDLKTSDDANRALKLLKNKVIKTLQDELVIADRQCCDLKDEVKDKEKQIEDLLHVNSNDFDYYKTKCLNELLIDENKQLKHIVEVQAQQKIAYSRTARKNESISKKLAANMRKFLSINRITIKILERENEAQRTIVSNLARKVINCMAELNLNKLDLDIFGG